MRPVPVLMYHHVNTHKGDIVTVTPEVFDGQMRYLAENGYRTLKLDELMAYMRGELTLREKAVVVTFDDGWLDNYIHAFPVLKKYRINATIFLVTDRTEKASGRPWSGSEPIPDHNVSKGLIDRGEADKVVVGWSHVREMAESGLVEFHSHTVSHLKCDALAGDELRREIVEPKKIIEERVGKECPYFCWPYGRYNKEAVELARDTGYRALFTVEPGVVKPGSDPFHIKRIVVKDNVSWFRTKMRIYTNAVLADLYMWIRKK